MHSHISLEEEENNSDLGYTEIIKNNLPHPHFDLYPQHLQLINITNFQLKINLDICNVSNIALVTTVHSACSNMVRVHTVHSHIYGQIQIH